MGSRRELSAVLLILTSFSSHIYGVTFSEDELKFFATLGLCKHFGGECGSVCAHRFITHKWGIPLCQDTTYEHQECCIGPPAAGSSEDEITTSFTTTTTTTTTTTNAPPESRSDAEERCGQPKVVPVRRKRIVGGHVASSDTWPWLVAFRSMLGSHACSGTVIGQRWVITAAHCFKYVSNPSLWRVRVGEYNIMLQEVGERDVHVQQIILYPGYRTRLEQRGTNETLHAKYVHDIALVRLSQDALTEPLCLPSPRDGTFLDYQDNIRDTEASSPVDYRQEDMTNQIETMARVEDKSRLMAPDGDVHRYNGIPSMGPGRAKSDLQFEDEVLPSRNEICWVAGWGLTLEANMEDHVLREVSGDIVDSRECSQMWGEPLDREMLCFGDGTYGPCVGDSGGPLSCERGGRFYLTGVVSWGTEECNVSGYPSVFTSLEPYLGWISEEIRNLS